MAYKIVQIRKDCIGCGACAAVCPDFWSMDEQGLAKLKDAKENGEQWELEVKTEEARAVNQEAADVCPVNIIKIEKK